MKKTLLGMFGALVLTIPLCFPAAASSAEITQKFQVEKVTDYDTGLTLGRCYVPEGYEFVSKFLAYGVTDGWQSPGSPYQLMLHSYNADKEIMTDMWYFSPISFAYTAEGYEPGKMNGDMLRMIPPVRADGFADMVAEYYFWDNETLEKAGGYMLTQDDDEFLKNRVDIMYNQFLISLGPLAGITFAGAECTYAEQKYTRELDGREYTTLIVTAMESCDRDINQVGVTIRTTSMTVPFIYILDTPSDLFEDMLSEFSLFIANTSMCDEFYIMYLDVINKYVGTIAIIGYANLQDVGAEAYLTDGYGSYDSESFCEYIMSVESYTTSDGQTVKVPNSYDYVYEDSDGNIIPSDSAFGPEGSIKLYRN